MNPRQPPAWMIGLAAFVLAVIAAGVALSLPSVWPVRPAWHDGGLRLFRDDHEVGVYFDRSRWLADRVAPYTPGHEQEYPPLGALYYALPRFFTGDPAVFEKIFVFVNAAMFGLLAGLAAWLLRRFGRSPAWLGLFCLPAFVYCSLWRFDLLPAVLAAVFLWAVCSDRPVAAFTALAAGVLAKYYPALFFVPFIMYLGSRRLDPAMGRRVSLGLIALAGVAAAGLLSVAAFAGFGAAVWPVLFHLGREFEIGSLGLAVLVALFYLGASGLWLGRVVSGIFFLLQFGATVVYAAWGKPADLKAFVRACLFILLPFLIFAHFFSPQWLLWLTPLYILVADRRETVALIALDLSVYLQFPVVFGYSPYGWPYLAASLIRTALMICLAWLNTRELIRSGALVLPKFRPGAAA